MEGKSLNGNRKRISRKQNDNLELRSERKMRKKKLAIKDRRILHIITVKLKHLSIICMYWRKEILGYAEESIFL